MKSLLDYIKDVIDSQSNSDIQQTEILVNQEYANCLLEINQS